MNQRQLFPHQIKALEYAKTTQNPAFILEMRLGKCLITIRWARTLLTPSSTQNSESVNGILVVAPNETLKQSWEKELILEKEAFVNIVGLDKPKRLELAASFPEMYPNVLTWILVSYETLRSTPELTDLPLLLVVLDESPVIKDPQSIISNVICGGSVSQRNTINGKHRRYASYSGFINARNKAILTGCVAPETQLDIFQQFKFLHNEFAGCKTYWHFRANYFTIKNPWTHKWEPKSPIIASRIKKEMHSLAFIMRRQDAGIKEKKIYETRIVPMLPEQKKAYKEVEEDFARTISYVSESIQHTRKNYRGSKTDRGNSSIDNSEYYETKYAVTRSLWCARIAGGSDVDGEFKWDNKINSLCSLLQTELSDQQVVIWFRFNAEIFAVQKALRRKKITNENLTGNSSPEERAAALNRFDKGKSRIILVQMKLGKFGLNMSVADTAIYYSMTYSCQEIIQSEDRIVDMQKKSPLLYIYLASENSVDEDVIKAASEKPENSQKLMQRMKSLLLERRGK